MTHSNQKSAWGQTLSTSHDSDVTLKELFSEQLLVTIASNENKNNVMAEQIAIAGSKKFARTRVHSLHVNDMANISE